MLRNLNPLLRQVVGSIGTLCLILLNPGCGTWIGNPGSGTGTQKSVVQLNIQSSDPNLALAGSLRIPVTGAQGKADGYLTLAEAYVALKEIKFKTTTGSPDTAGEFSGPYIVDLIANKTTPSIGSIEVTATSYQDIDLKLEKLEADHFSEPLPSSNIVNNSIYLSGTYTNAGGSSKTFRLAFSLSEEFTLSSSRTKSRDISLDEGNNAVILAFRPAVWFAFDNAKTNENKLDLSSLTSSAIDLNKDSESTSQKLLEVIKNNIKQSARFGKDNNGDGSLGTDEDDGH